MRKKEKTNNRQFVNKIFKLPTIPLKNHIASLKSPIAPVWRYTSLDGNKKRLALPLPGKTSKFFQSLI